MEGIFRARRLLVSRMLQTISNLRILPFEFHPQYKTRVSQFAFFVNGNGFATSIRLLQWIIIWILFDSCGE